MWDVRVWCVWRLTKFDHVLWYKISWHVSNFEIQLLTLKHPIRMNLILPAAVSAVSDVTIRSYDWEREVGIYRKEPMWCISHISHSDGIVLLWCTAAEQPNMRLGSFKYFPAPRIRGSSNCSMSPRHCLCEWLMTPCVVLTTYYNLICVWLWSTCWLQIPNT